MKAVWAIAMFVAAACGKMAVERDMIDRINTKQSLWKAKANPISRLSPEEARALSGTQRNTDGSLDLPRMTYGGRMKFAAEESFDSREVWRDCPSTKEIRDQRSCGSCWAFAVAEAISDRECIINGATPSRSAEDILSCSKGLILSCGNCKNGGRPSCAWKWYVSTGVVSEECVPYTAGVNDSDTTPKCASSCTGNADIAYDSDKIKGKSSYSLKGESDIMEDVATNGPISVLFDMYEDFYSYSSGIYNHTEGSKVGGHVVKLIGWGVENGVKYWTIANSWGPSWGENGFFRMIRGEDHCGIESQGYAGTPVSRA